MKVCFEVILVFSIIEIETHAFIAGDSANVRNLQERKSRQILSPTDLNQLNSDGLLQENYTLEIPFDSRAASFNEQFKKDFQIPMEQTLEKNYYPDEPFSSNSMHLASTENYISQPNNEDNYKPLIYEDSRSTETSYEMLKATPANPSNNANKPPTMPELPFGLPNGYSSSNSQGSQTPTLIMGGFSILVMPMPGLTPGNMANFIQPGQQLGKASGTNPFLGPYPASG